MKTSILVSSLAACVLSTPLAFGADLKIKTLSPAEDSAKKTVLIGRNVADNMIVTLEIERAEGMWMLMGKPAKWMEKPMAKGEIYHVEVKPTDPGSKTRLPYADVKFSAINHDNNKKISGTLSPSWGEGGLHYGYNSALAGDGAYEATVTVGAPGFGRTADNKDMWTKPVVSKFHFKLAGTNIVEVSEPAPAPK